MSVLYALMTEGLDAKQRDALDDALEEIGERNVEQRRAFIQSLVGGEVVLSRGR